MEHDFWLQKWREGSIGFHRQTPMPQLLRHWPDLALPVNARVLVPLCGKTPDMVWLRQQGHEVLGVELSPLAVEQFFNEQQLTPEIVETPAGVHYRADGMEIIQADVFDLVASTLATCDAVYDRAALIALPPVLRQRYAREIYGRLPVGCRGLVVTLEYDQNEMNGPPFAVDAAMVGALLGDDWQVRPLEHREALQDAPHFRSRGLTALQTGVYQIDGG